MRAMPSDELTTRDAAHLLGVDISTLNRWVTAGRLIPCRTIDGPKRAALHLFDRVDIDRIIADRDEVAS